MEGGFVKEYLFLHYNYSTIYRPSQVSVGVSQDLHFPRPSVFDHLLKEVCQAVLLEAMTQTEHRKYPFKNHFGTHGWTGTGGHPSELF